MSRHIVVTGSASGIGQALARQLSEAGDTVIGIDLKDADVCADPDCEGLVLDLSRNRSRRFCSTSCTNRAAVAAYRARQR